MALHHTQIKKIAAAGLEATIENGVLTITMDGVSLVSGPEKDAKELIAEAINQTEDDEFDLEALRDEQFGDEDAMGEDTPEDDEDEAEDEAEDSDSPLARTMAKYRAHYAEIAPPEAPDSNGDALALALRAHITRVSDDGKTTWADTRALRDVLDQNGLPTPKEGRNAGHTRMIMGNALRGYWKKGNAVIVGAIWVQPTADALARKAEAQAKADAKAARAAQPRQTKEERAARAKERRQQQQAERDAALEPEQRA